MLHCATTVVILSAPHDTDTLRGRRKTCLEIDSLFDVFDLMIFVVEIFHFFPILSNISPLPYFKQAKTFSKC